jgi:hypothetical protein
MEDSFIDDLRWQLSELEDKLVTWQDNVSTIMEKLGNKDKGALEDLTEMVEDIESMAGVLVEYTVSDDDEEGE